MTAADFALLGIDSTTIAYVMAWGVGWILTMWSLGFGVGVALRSIKQV